eukprot:scaffold301016_cov18-Tisochrysis_lutea.AAC.2
MLAAKAADVVLIELLLSLLGTWLVVPEGKGAPAVWGCCTTCRSIDIHTHVDDGFVQSNVQPVRKCHCMDIHSHAEDVFAAMCAICEGVQLQGQVTCKHKSMHLQSYA